MLFERVALSRPLHFLSRLYLVKTVAQYLRSRLLRVGGLVLTASVLSGLMNAASIVITIRHLSLEAFGLLTFAVTTMQLVGSLSNVGLHEALMVFVSRAEAARQPREAARSLSGVLRLRVAVTLLVLLGGALVSTPIAENVFGKRELAGPVFFGFVGGCGISLAQFSLTALRAFGAFGRFAITMVARFAALLGTLGVLALMGRLDLHAALVVNALAPFLTFAIGLAAMPAGSLREPVRAREILPRIWSFSKWITVGNLLSVFAGRLEIYLLTAFASASEVAIYGVAFKLSGGLLFLQTNIRTVLFPELARRAGGQGLVAFVRKIVWLFVILGGLLWGVGLLASLFIGPLFGRSYLGSVPVFLVLLVARAILIPLTPLNLLLLTTSRTRASALFAGVQLVALVVTGLSLIPMFGAAGAAWTQVLVSAVSAVCLVIMTRPMLTAAKHPVHGESRP